MYDKDRKTFLLSKKIIDEINKEADLLGGRPGLIANAAFAMFMDAPPEQKSYYVQKMSRDEIEEVYGQPIPPNWNKQSSIAEAMIPTEKEKAADRQAGYDMVKKVKEKENKKKKASIVEAVEP